MVYNSAFIHLICEICMAIGGLATFFTLLWLIFDSYRKSKKINTIQQIQSHQLEALFEPDIRISKWSNNNNGDQNLVVINNHGEDLILLDIYESSETGILTLEAMKNWFPYPFDKDKELHIPLSKSLNIIQGDQGIIIRSRNRLGIEYESTMNFFNSKPQMGRPQALK